MGYLFFEIWFLLLIAFVLGMFVQWWFCCRKDAEDSESDVAVAPLAAETIDTNVSQVIESAAETAHQSIENASIDPATLDDQWKPMAFSSVPESTDDLKRIKGIGAVIEKTLNELGIYQFEQIAEWNPDNVAWIEGFLSFQGRVGREDWISQAKTLASGKSTEFAKRVDGGEVDY